MQRPASALSLSILIAFCSPVLVFQGVELLWRLYMPAFLGLHMGMSMAAVASLMFWTRMIDAVIDPLIGVVSDRLVTPWGRRRPWVVASLPMLIVGVLLLLWWPPGTSPLVPSCGAVLLFVGHTVLATPHGGWTLEIEANPDQRTRLMGVKMWVFSAGTVLTLLGLAITERVFAFSLDRQVMVIGASLLLLAPVTIALALASVGEPALRTPATPITLDSIIRILALVLTAPALRMILLLYALLGMADAAEGAVAFFYFRDVQGLAGWSSSLLVLPVLISLIMIPVWTTLGIRFSREQVMVFILFLRMTSLCVLLLPPGYLVPLMAFLAFRSLAWGGDYLLLRAMLADHIGVRIAQIGEGLAASHYALFNFSMKVAAAIGGALALGVVAASGFVPDKSVSPTAQQMITLLYALPSCVAGIVCLAVIFFDRRGRSAARCLT